MTASGIMKKTAVAALFLAAAQANAQEDTRPILGKPDGILPCSYWIEVRAAAREDPNDPRFAEVMEWVDDFFAIHNKGRLAGGTYWPPERIDRYCSRRPDAIAMSIRPAVMREPKGERQ